MDERFDNRSESDGGPTTPHLTPEQITAYLDGDLTPAERAGLDAHLRTCPACRREMSDVRSTVLLLRGLPDYRPRRSFQLIPGRAAIRRPWWERVGLKILPALPALRAATVAVAILLAVVSAGQVIRDRNGNESPNEQPAMLSATTVAPTSQPVGAAASTATTGTAPTRTSGPVQQAKATQEPTESLQANAAPREEQEPTEAPAAAGGGIGGGAESAPPEPTSDTSSADESTDGDGAAESAPADDAEAASQGAAASAAEATESDTDEGDTDSVGNGEDTQSIAMAAVAEGTTTAEATTTGAGGRSASSSDETADTLAAPEATPPPPTPTTIPTAIPATPIQLPATPSPAATAATPAASPVPVALDQKQPESDDDSGVSGWRIAQIALLVLLLWLVVTVVGLQRIRARR